ncbi:MAG TPA: hypothetical protein VF641_10565 [Methylobacterium sp.]|jgi:hypothetical protein
MSTSRLLAAIAAVVVLSPATTGQAQTLLYRGLDGPVVLDTDRGTGRPIPSLRRPDLDLALAIPVPSVMNGGGFGLTGTDYYSDGATEGSFGKGRRRNEYILAPAYKNPMH